MTEVDRMIERIHDEYARFRQQVADKPSHFILCAAARQALKLRVNSPHPFSPPLDIETYFGIPVIDLERVIIID